MALLEIDNVRTGYGEITVLWDISINVENKGITALLGANGAGKSTILNCIVGLQKTWSGDLRFDGSSIINLSPHKRVELGIAMVPEGRRIFTEMTVLENLLMGAYLKRAREWMQGSLERVYQLFPVMKERKRQRAGTLSGGEQQMLAVGRALMSRPKLLLCDEISTGLSPKLIILLMGTLAKLSEEGLPIFLVEQHVERALEISQKAYVLETGKITMKGRSEVLRTDERLRKAYMGI